MSDGAIPYGRQHIDEDDIAAVANVLRGDWLTTGPAVEAFESALSEVVGGHPVVSVNSGTAALHAAYAAAGVAAGTNIVTTPLTFAATATTALHLGARVRFADVDEATLLMDPDSAAEATTDATRAVVPVDFAGQPADVDSLRGLTERIGAALIEDAAHSLGGRSGGRPVGDLADLTTFSFHPVKTITTGEGGAVVVRDQTMLEAVRRFRNHGLVRSTESLRRPDEGAWHQEVQALGLNYRLPDILAALGASQLKKLPEFLSRRSEIVSRYRSSLSEVPGIRLLHTREGVEPAWHLFPIRISGGRRRQVFDRMRERGVIVQVHYLPVHQHPIFTDLGYKSGMCPVAEVAYRELLSLPLYPDLTGPQQDRVISELISALSM